MTDRAVSASEFKDTCLRVIDDVSSTGMEVVVTRHGKPLVRIVPVTDARRDRSLEGAILHQDEDLSSTGESWEADG